MLLSKLLEQTHAILNRFMHLMFLCFVMGRSLELLDISSEPMSCVVFGRSYYALGRGVPGSERRHRLAGERRSAKRRGWADWGP